MAGVGWKVAEVVWGVVGEVRKVVGVGWEVVRKDWEVAGRVQDVWSGVGGG